MFFNLLDRFIRFIHWFSPIQKWELLRRFFYLFNQMFLSEGGHFYVDMHFYAIFFTYGDLSEERRSSTFA